VGAQTNDIGEKERELRETNHKEEEKENMFEATVSTAGPLALRSILERDHRSEFGRAIRACVVGIGVRIMARRKYALEGWIRPSH